MIAKHWKRTRILLFLLLLAALLFATGALLAQIETRSGKHFEASDILSDMGFFAASELTVSAKSTDDIFAAGGEISINGAQADHMITAGGDITAVNVAFHDLILAGGDVTLVSGTVTDDLVSFSGDLNVQPEFKVGGSAVLSGGTLTLEAPITGELRAAGGRIRLNASVDGDVYLAGEDIVVGPNTHIGGSLSHRAREIDIDPNATIAGEIIALEPLARPDVENWGVRAAAAAAVFALAFFIGIAVLVVVITAVLPALMNSSAAMMRQKPLSTFGIGFIITAAAPVVIAFFFATIFGIPLALLIVALYAATAPLAIAAFAYFLGMSGRRVATKGEPSLPGLSARMGWSVLAVVLLVVIGLVPILGQLFWLLAYVFGVGAVMTRGGKALAQKA